MYMKTLSLLALVGAASAHMSMFYPPPLGSAPSINKQSTTTDKEFNYPLGCCGSSGTDTEPSPGLCRGHLDKFDTEEASVTWTAGQDAHFQLTDYSYDPNAPGSTHSGGSCQVGFSTDKGATWKVAASYHGACPYHTEDGSPEAQTFDFKVPTGMPDGDALFAWIWLNREHESFMNCAKVKVTGGSGSTTPTTPTTPSTPSTTPKQSSGTTPQQPAYSSTPQQPDDEDDSPNDEDDTTPPAVTSVAPRPSNTGRPRPRPSSTSSSSRGRPTQTPDDSDDSVDSDDSDDSGDSHWSSRPHKEVKANARKYDVDGWSCECRRETLNSRCYCDSSDSSAKKRAAIEKKALRMHRRTLYKRVDACDWASAPAMEVSYYTEDAKCAPNAKLNMPESDTFELGWNVNCGVVEGDGQYQIKMMECNMYGV
ncbi:hypothetical protein EK21DRAFT_57250 [Setomelanomma holmii]|uniref:Lytic polysaccharide monooxygenase n=1 Tax=Setomelanomma holmii TaxID=210430 RepID=A0A9P4LRU1_9PLEO|nr:hypothetical protein EK21DRAFT_57250 [Setomelanomma holmii]